MRGWFLTMCVALLPLGGCQAILGIHDTTGAGGRDAAVIGVDAATLDARVFDGPVLMPDARLADAPVLMPDAPASPADAGPLVTVRFAASLPPRVPRNGSVAAQVIIPPTTDFSGDVTVSLVNLPSGVSAASIQGHGGETLAMTIAATGSAPIGPFDVTLHAETSGSPVNAPARILVEEGRGVLDSSFGSAGTVAVPFNVTGGNAAALALQSDGGVIVGGNVTGFWTLARVTRDGAVDTTFGSNGDGTVTGPVGTLAALAVQSDDSIIAAGVSNAAFTVIRVTAGGQLDPQFGVQGQGHPAAAYIAGVPIAVGVEPIFADRIVVAANVPGTPAFGVLCAFSPAGVADGEFGPGDACVRGTAGDSYAALSVSPDTNSLTVAGARAGNQFLVSRVDSIGTVIGSFGGGTVLFGPTTAHASAITTLSQRQVVVAGSDGVSWALGELDATGMSGFGEIVGVQTNDAQSALAAVASDVDDVVFAAGSGHASGQMPHGEAAAFTSSGATVWTSAYSVFGPIDALTVTPDGMLLVLTTSAAGIAVARIWP